MTVSIAPTILLIADAGKSTRSAPRNAEHISSPLAVIGYASTFLGVAGFYMSVAFYAISIFINVICTGMS